MLLAGVVSKLDFGQIAGPISSILGPTARPSVVTRGQSVDFTISPTGQVTVAGDSFKLASWSGSGRLSEANLAYSNGILTGDFGLANGSGTSLQGVRFDFVSAAETFKVKNSDGTEDTKVRSQNLDFSAPAYFGDLADGESSVTLSGFAKGIKFAPETVSVTVHSVVSGISFFKQFTRPKTSIKGCGLEVDSSGDVIVGEANHQSLWRFAEDGEFKAEFGTLPTYAREVALNPVSGDYLVGLYNSHNDSRVGADGTTSSAFSSNLAEWPGLARFTKGGKLYMKVGNAITPFDGYTQASAGLAQAAGLKIRDYDAFDFEDDDTMWVFASNNLVRVDMKAGSSSIKVKPGTGAFGEILPTQRSAVRCSPLREIYVAEEGVNGKILGRISVFDNQGRFVRSFGMAGQKANFHAYLPGQIHGSIRDFAFGRDGRVYVSQYDASCGITEYLEF